MSVDRPLARIAVGVVVERRKAESRWIDFLWRPVAVLAGAPEAAPWTVLSDDGETVRYFAGGAEIALYRTETGYYRDNLASGAPSLWVVLRPTGVEPPYQVAAVTADPNEGEAIHPGGQRSGGGVADAGRGARAGRGLHRRAPCGARVREDASATAPIPMRWRGVRRAKDGKP